MARRVPGRRRRLLRHDLRRAEGRAARSGLFQRAQEWHPQDGPLQASGALKMPSGAQFEISVDSYSTALVIRIQQPLAVARQYLCPCTVEDHDGAFPATIVRINEIERVAGLNRKPLLIFVRKFQSDPRSYFGSQNVHTPMGHLPYSPFRRLFRSRVPPPPFLTIPRSPQARQILRVR